MPINLFDKFKYLDKGGLSKLISLIKKNETPHWSGTYAEYIAQSASIPAGAYVSITDDEEGHEGIRRRDVESSAGVTTGTLRGFINGMLNDIAPNTWENGVYAGAFNSTHSGGGDLGSWVGLYMCHKHHSGSYGTEIDGVANNKKFTSMWTGTEWDTYLCGAQEHFNNYTNIGSYQGSSLTLLPSGQIGDAQWIRINGVIWDQTRDTVNVRYVGSSSGSTNIIVNNYSLDTDGTLIILCRNLDPVAVTVDNVWVTIIRN